MRKDRSQVVRDSVINKSFLIGVLLLINGTMSTLSAQACDCLSDFRYLESKLRETPAFKGLGKQELVLFESEINEALEYLKRSSISELECLFIMNKSALLINDHHSRIYGSPNDITSDLVSNKSTLDSLKNLDFYRQREIRSINIDSLKSALSKEENAKIEGIYHWNEKLTIGVYSIEEGYEAVVINSKLALFQPNDLLYKIHPYDQNNHILVGYSLASRRLIAFNERIEMGVFIGTGFKKSPTLFNYQQSPHSEKFLFKGIDKEIDYIKVRSFSSFYPTLSQAENFYDSIKSILNKPNLILDLRGNSGGGPRNSNILFGILRKYATSGKIHVIVSHRTISNAEQFAVRLSNLKNVITYGQNTNGTLAYEVKNSTYNLPCNVYTAVLTSKSHKKYLEFEGSGYTPNVSLAIDRPWVEQVKNIINASSKKLR